MLYALHLCRDVCQLFLIKTEEKYVLIMDFHKVSLSPQHWLFSLDVLL